MLILSRRCGESIIVDDEVTLTVLSIKGKQVRIGIDAPDHVSVHREEIYQRIKDGDNPAKVGKDSEDTAQDPGGADSSAKNANESNSPQAQAHSSAKSVVGSQAGGQLRAVDSVAQAEVSVPASASHAAKAGDPKLV